MVDLEVRWSCRYKSIETFTKVFTAIIHKLKLIDETHHSVEHATLVHGYLIQMKYSMLVALLLIMEKLLKATYCLSNALQDCGAY